MEEGLWRKGSTQFGKTVMCSRMGASEDRSCSVFWQRSEGSEAVPPNAVEIATLQGRTRGCLACGGNCVQSSTLSISTWLDEGSKMLLCSHNRFMGVTASDQKHGLNVSWPRGRGPCSPGLGMVSWGGQDLPPRPAADRGCDAKCLWGVPPKSACQTGCLLLPAHLPCFPPTVLEWKTTMYGPMNNNSISYQEGKLKVKEAGLYYIYSQVSFCTKPETLAPFTLYIYLYLPMEEDRLLLKGLDTHSNSVSLCNLQSIREGGVFKLREGDMVFVNVTDSTRVNYSHGSTYFGIFKL